MNLNGLSKRAINFKFRKFNTHIIGLCHTYHVNLNPLTKQTAHALQEVHYINICDTRAVGPCILVMRMAFNNIKTFPNKALRFIADGYSAYPLAKQQLGLKGN